MREAEGHRGKRNKRAAGWVRVLLSFDCRRIVCSARVQSSEAMHNNLLRRKRHQRCKTDAMHAVFQAGRQGGGRGGRARVRLSRRQSPKRCVMPSVPVKHELTIGTHYRPGAGCALLRDVVFRFARHRVRQKVLHVF